MPVTATTLCTSFPVIYEKCASMGKHGGWPQAMSRGARGFLQGPQLVGGWGDTRARGCAPGCGSRRPGVGSGERAGPPPRPGPRRPGSLVWKGPQCSRARPLTPPWPGHPISRRETGEGTCLGRGTWGPRSGPGSGDVDSSLGCSVRPGGTGRGTWGQSGGGRSWRPPAPAVTQAVPTRGGAPPLAAPPPPFLQKEAP